MPPPPLVESLGLFLSAFTSATLLPGTSEGALAALIALGGMPAASAVAVATAGNTLGSVVNWAIGRFLAGYRDHPRFPVPPAAFDKAVAAYRRFGIASLLLSWVPVIGDPLTLVAGFLRTPLWVFVPVVALAKAARYAVVAGLTGLF